MEWIPPFQRRSPTESDQCSTGKFTSRWSLAICSGGKDAVPGPSLALGKVCVTPLGQFQCVAIWVGMGGSVGANPPPQFRSHALKGHRIPAQGATLGIHPERQTCVLKERRIAAGLESRPRPSLCGVPSEHTYSFGCGSQGDALGWYALPRQGKWGDGMLVTMPSSGS